MGKTYFNETYRTCKSGFFFQFSMFDYTVYEKNIYIPMPVWVMVFNGTQRTLSTILKHSIIRTTFIQFIKKMYVIFTGEFTVVG